MGDTDNRATSVRIYEDDLQRLKRLQRRVSDSRDRWLTMPEIIRDLLDDIEARAEAGE